MGRICTFGVFDQNLIDRLIGTVVQQILMYEKFKDVDSDGSPTQMFL